MDLKVEDVRMWDFFGGNDLYANMEDQLNDELTTQSNALIDKQHILLEERVRRAPSALLVLMFKLGNCLPVLLRSTSRHTHAPTSWLPSSSDKVQQ